MRGKDLTSRRPIIDAGVEEFGKRFCIRTLRSQCVDRDLLRQSTEPQIRGQNFMRKIVSRAAAMAGQESFEACGRRRGFYRSRRNNEIGHNVEKWQWRQRKQQRQR